MIDEKKLANAAMSEEELDNVSGGGGPETAEDSKLLYERGLVEDWHGDEYTMWLWLSASKSVDEGWAKAGITCVTKWSGDNLYFKDGKQISRYEAHKYLKENFNQVKNID